MKIKHAGNIELGELGSELGSELDRQLDQVNVGTVLLSLAALSMAVAAYLLG